MKKFVCTVCGYVHEGDAAPEKCPVCGAPASKFKEQDAEMSWAAEHEVGVAQGASEDIIEDLRANYEASARKSECIWRWQELPTEKVIRRSDFTGRRPLMRKRSMRRNSQSFSARL